MKRILALLLALTLVFALAACGSKSETKTDEPAKTEEPAKTDEPAKTEEPAKTDEPAKTEEPAPAAATWPNGEVTILAGYSVGSLTDVNIHTIADWITEKTGVTVKIVNDDVGGGANLANELVNAAPDGQTLMLIGMNCISNYYNGTWAVNPADSTKFKVACGSIQPLPDSGCVILTQADAPYNTWDELAAYAAANPKTVTVASIAGKVMDIKMKALFNGTGVADNIRWAPTDNKGATAGLLGGNINVVILDETTAAGYLADPANNVKAIINCRADNDFSYYEGLDTISAENLALIKAIPTLLDVFGADKAQAYMVPNRSMFVVPAGTPDEIVAAIAAVIDPIANEVDDPNNDNDFYSRCRINGGTSKYYTWPGEEISAEWGRLDPIIKAIVEMKVEG